MTKPIILIDQDGPLADFDSALWAALRSGAIWANCTPDTQTDRYLEDHVRKEDMPKVRAIVEASGWFRDLPPTPGAREGMNALAKVAEVWVCTKPLEANPTCRDEKAAWVREHLGPEWEDRLILAGDKSLIQGAVLLDDAPKPKWFNRAPWRPVIFPTPWNNTGSVWEGLPRWTWGDDPQVLLDIASGEPPVKPDFEQVPFFLFERTST